MKDSALWSQSVKKTVAAMLITVQI